MPTTMYFRGHPDWPLGAVIPVSFIADPGEPVEGLPFVVWCHPANRAVSTATS